jgi:hypothetical protein
MTAPVCEVHDWPTDGLATQIILLVRKRGRGGVDICLDCVRRAKASIAAELLTRREIA